MGLSGAAGGAAQSLEQILTQQMLQAQAAQRDKQAQQQMAMEQQRIAESIRSSQVDEGHRQQTIDIGERTRRDRNNDRGLDLMKADKSEMNFESAVATLPPHLKQIGGLMKVGAVGKLNPEDLEAPEAKAARERATREQGITDQIRIRNATRTPETPNYQRVVIDGKETFKTPEEIRQMGGVPQKVTPVDANLKAEAVDTAKEAKRIATALLASKGFDGAFGVVDARLPTMRQDTADAETLRNSLTSLLTLENTGKLKGVLSNADMAILRQASSTISAPMSSPAARAELNRLVEVMGRAAGEGNGMPVMNPVSSRDGAPSGKPSAADLMKKYGGG